MVKPIKIVIDARMYGLEHAGIGRYVLNLVKEIKSVKDTSEVSDERRTPRMVEEEQKSIEFYLLVRENKYAEIKKEIGDGFKLVATEAPHYSLKEQITVPIQLFKLKPNLVHFPHFNVPVFWWGKQVVTIHDLIKHESRGTETTTRWRPLYWFKYLNYRFLVWLAVKRAAKILVPSQWWRKELIRRYGLPKSKVAVTYEGVSEKFNLPAKSSKLKAKILNKYGIEKPFVIYTGALYPHKNVERLVKAIKVVNNTECILAKRTKDTREVDAKFLNPNFGSQNKAVLMYSSSQRNKRRLRRPPRGWTELNLVVVCSRNVFYERFKKKIKQMGAEKFVNLVGFVPDEDLVTLYRQAEAFVFPSLLEGFGLPGLEAMACGCPVVSSSASCLPEVYGNAAVYFDPLDVEDIAEKIKKVTSNTSTCNTLIEKGYQQVKKYSWQKMAKETIGVYKDILYARGIRL